MKTSRAAVRAVKDLVLVALLAAGAPASAQPTRLDRAAGPDRDRPGPWDNDVLVYVVAPGGEPKKLATFERAGVPTAARLRDGRLLAAFQNFPRDDDRNFDRVAVRLSGDEGRTWSEAEPIAVAGMEDGLARPFDPTLVPLPDGRVRLYFTSNRSPDFRRSAPAIYSAISNDGIRYVFEPGVRFALEGRIVIDCAAALHEGAFHLIVPDNGAAEDFMARPRRGQEPAGVGYHAISKDGLAFERVADVKLSSARNRWLGNLQSDGGKLVFFGTGPGPWPVNSGDGLAWEIPAASIRVPGADPGAVKLRDGSWLLLVTGAPRPGTPSALRRDAAPDQSPDVRPGGLASHQVHSATSADGLKWTRDAGVRVERASVPCAINDGDLRVLLYFVRPPDRPGRPETVGCAVSADGLKFEPAPEFRIEGLGALKAVDPSIVKDRDGKFRLFYLASDERGDPARGPNPHAIHLALSDDGLRFREVGPVFSHDDLVDPDVFHFKDRWFLYVFAGRATIIAASADGLKFGYLRDLTPRDWGTTAPVPLPGGGLRLYAFEQRVPAGNAVRSFLSADGLEWNAEPGERLKARAGEQITDPFVIPWRGGWKMYFKTSPARTRQPRSEPEERARRPERAADRDEG